MTIRRPDSSDHPKPTPSNSVEATLARLREILPSCNADLSDAGDERRNEQRLPYQTLITTLIIDKRTSDVTPRMVHTWSVDVSKSGAGLISREEISHPRLILRFLLPKAGARCLECEIVNARVFDRFLGENGVFHRYGVRFLRLLSEEEMEVALEALRATAAASAAKTRKA